MHSTCVVVLGRFADWPGPCGCAAGEGFSPPVSLPSRTWPVFCVCAIGAGGSPAVSCARRKCPVPSVSTADCSRPWHLGHLVSVLPSGTATVCPQDGLEHCTLVG